MLPLILGSAGLGAALGGIQGYQQSGGDLGRTFQGALSGGLLGGATGGLGGIAGGAASRMAGSALGLTEGALGKTLLQKAAAGTLTGKEALLLKAPALAGGAANLGTQLAGAAVLAPVAGALGNLAGQAIGRPAGAAAQLGAGYAGSRGPGAVDYNQIGGNAVPVVDAYGNVSVLGTDPLGNILPGMTRSAESLREATAQRDAMRTIYPEVAAASEARSKKEFERQMAAAGIRQNIETAANMIQRSQQSAQQIGQTAAQQMGNALTAQYQYQ
jgi:hypothetical protein